MSSSSVDIPTRAPAATSADDTILPFEVAALDLRGRVARLGPAVDEILNAHDYPAPVAKLLGEAIVLAVLLGSALKMEGRFILQTQSDGPVRMLVVDFTTPGKVRACARFDAARVNAVMASSRDAAGMLLGRGHLAMTIDQGPDTSRYQGLVYRLFHERGVRVFRSTAVTAQCSCSRAGVADMLRSFSQDDRDHMIENGVITVTCEFCNSNHVFEPAAVANAG